MTGLCHGVFHVARYLSKELGCGTESLSYSAAGINHLTWFTSLRCKGEDMTGKLKTLAARKIEKFRQQRELITSFEENGSHCRGNGMEVVQDPFSWMLTEMYGAFPAVMDRHVTEFFPGLFSSEKSYFGKTLGVDAYGFESVIAHGDSIYAEMEEVAFSKSPMPRKYLCGSEGEHEQVVEIISNIRLNREKIYSVNLPNRGRIPNLPYDAIVEAPAVTSGNGLRPLVPPPLPDCLAAILASKFLWIETVAEAALEGSMEKFVQALYLDSNSIDPYRTRAMAIELVEAQKKHLPQFETPSKGSGRICRIA